MSIRWCLPNNSFSLEDVCTHDGVPLAEGSVEGDQIPC
jgi:nitrite reductase/ring-hydroxylating ferredoxin subunit